MFKKGETVSAKVLKIDTASRRVSLGIKQLNDIWGNWFAAHKINDVVRGKVSRLTTFGAFVELADGVEGHYATFPKSKSLRRRRQRRRSAAVEDAHTFPAGARPRVRF